MGPWRENVQAHQEPKKAFIAQGGDAGVAEQVFDAFDPAGHRLG